VPDAGRDWNAEWTKRSDARDVVHDASFWDRRVRSFRSGDEASPYVAGFLERMRCLPGESVLDVGSGAGTLAIPLARAGHQVTALDFSQGMLAALRERAAEEGLHVRTVLASWDDDWAAAGVEPVDIAVASRALDVRDLRAALRKLDASARRRVCITVPADGLLYPGLLAHQALGRPYRLHGDGELAAGVLRDIGLEPEVSYLEHASVSHYHSPEDALESLRRMLAPADEREEQALQRYVREHVVETTAGDGRSVWTQEPAITVRWAFLAWDKDARAAVAATP
jgi:SAM-dependent methyltransferase